MSHRTPFEQPGTLVYRTRDTAPKLHNSGLLALTVMSFLFAVAMAANSVTSGVPY